MTAVLTAVDVHFSYPGGVEALRGVSLQIERGEMVAVLAASGGGKTTLLKLLAGLIRPHQGEILIGDRRLRDLKDRDLYSRLSLVFQNPTDQLFATTVNDDVAFGPRNLGLAESEIESRVQRSLALVGVSGLRERAIHTLSFGQQKRVAVAGVLAMRPEILVLDEPVSGLDPKAAQQMITLLKQLQHDHGITLVVATHDVDLIAEVADRFCVLNAGKVAMLGTARDVFKDPDELGEVGLCLPRLAQLFHTLRQTDAVPLGPLPFTESDARRELLGLLAQRSVKAAS
jgi:cobalt/nickel transport system ATP-binding protein